MLIIIRSRLENALAHRYLYIAQYHDSHSNREFLVKLFSIKFNARLVRILFNLC
jgi:hypothetical protein